MEISLVRVSAKIAKSVFGSRGRREHDPFSESIKAAF
jgi:hypothetical protein